MVCFDHFISTVGYIENEKIKSAFALGRTGVFIFFVISGIVIPLSMIRGGYTIGNWGNFMLKRVARLEPPYLASIILALCYFKIRMIIAGSSAVHLPVFPSSKDVALHIGYLVPFAGAKWIQPPYWTLCIEFQYYIALSLLLPLALNGNSKSRYCFYFIFLAIPFILPHDAFFPLYAPLFLIGILYAFSIMNIIESKEYLNVTALCIVVSFITLPFVDTIAAGLLTLLIVQYLPGLTNKVLKFLGNISYSIYLIHKITGSALINILSHRFRAGYQKPIVIMTGYLFTIACSYVFYRIIEKNSQKLSSRIKYKKHDPSLSVDGKMDQVV
ncbi:hypothetical protein A3860_10795 [Niastella vici]|uniref:Acyltransferase 3 domain-containing protein n=2 Tax=Niastella vici TaxID=1703345 RepID=A0A1V9FFB2_9BACT|nr:hypothetical protein A3860_10795 [Niastella vici]